MKVPFTQFFLAPKFKLGIYNFQAFFLRFHGERSYFLDFFYSKRCICEYMYIQSTCTDSPKKLEQKREASIY